MKENYKELTKKEKKEFIDKFIDEYFSSKPYNKDEINYFIKYLYEPDLREYALDKIREKIGLKK